MMGKTPALLYGPQEAPELTRRMLEGVGKNGKWAGEVAFHRSDGSEGLCETEVVPHGDEYGRPVAAIFVYRDITRRRELEKRVEELESGSR